MYTQLRNAQQRPIQRPTAERRERGAAASFGQSFFVEDGDSMCGNLFSVQFPADSLDIVKVSLCECWYLSARFTMT